MCTSFQKCQTPSCSSVKPTKWFLLSSCFSYIVVLPWSHSSKPETPSSSIFSFVFYYHKHPLSPPPPPHRICHKLLIYCSVGNRQSSWRANKGKNGKVYGMITFESGSVGAPCHRRELRAASTQTCPGAVVFALPVATQVMSRLKQGWLVRTVRNNVTGVQSE